MIYFICAQAGETLHFSVEPMVMLPEHTICKAAGHTSDPDVLTRLANE
jgi:hypothetical protein